MDASEKTYGIAVYIKSEQEEVKTILAYTRKKIYPPKQLTIPKMESLAVLTGTKTIKFIQKAPSESRKNDLVRLQCVLKWIHNRR